MSRRGICQQVTVCEHTRECRTSHIVNCCFSVVGTTTDLYANISIIIVVTGALWWRTSTVEVLESLRNN